MAKKSMVARRDHSLKAIKRYGEKRAKLRARAKAGGDYEEVEKAVVALQKLPINSSSARLVRRCLQCNRPKGVYRKFGLCRICLRKHLMVGDVPGGRMASW